MKELYRTRLKYCRDIMKGGSEGKGEKAREIERAYCMDLPLIHIVDVESELKLDIRKDNRCTNTAFVSKSPQCRCTKQIKPHPS